MTAQIIDGRIVAAEVEHEVRAAVAELKARGITPGLVAVRVGDDPASEVYVRNKAKKAEELGFNGVQRHFPGDLSEAELLEEIDRLNKDDECDGILLQLPVPKQINAKRALDAIAPEKDVDGFHPINVGRLHQGLPSLVPCTPAGVIRLIDSTRQPISRTRAVVVGRSDIVGKPVAALLMQRDATVTVCHSKTADLAAVVREADIVVAAIGRPLFVTRDMVKPGAIVIDVGINRIEQTSDVVGRLSDQKRSVLELKGSVLVGDVDFPAVAEVAGWITPVPNGVGPMTIMMLMANTVRAAAERRR